MTHPWLEIPASDYDGHMRSPNVAQQQFLAEVFKQSLVKHDCSTIALLGCATGNGLEYVKDETTQKVTAIDFNPDYLEVLRQRYAGRIAGLEVMEADLETCRLDEKAYSLIFAGLIFEYLDARILLAKIVRWLRPGGVLVSILQLTSPYAKRVSESPFKSLNRLNSVMELILPQRFTSMANEAGLQEMAAETVTLKSGKSFYIGTYRADG